MSTFARVVGVNLGDSAVQDDESEKEPSGLHVVRWRTSCRLIGSAFLT